MLPAIELLFLILLAIGGVLVYRQLIHSKRFSKLVADVTCPSPEDEEEVIDRLDAAEYDAKRRAMDAENEVARLNQAVKRINRRINRDIEF